METGGAKLLVFPEKPKAGERSLLSSPVEEPLEKVVSWPGEYDFDGIFIKGIGQDDGRQVSYAGTIDGVRCAFVNAPIMEWTDADLEKLGTVDVLMIAAQDEKKFKTLVENVDPRIVILFDGEKDLQACIKACGVGSAETLAELKVQAGSLPADTRKVVVLGE